ncbi:hypothetical protein MBAV_001386 [Candidatus Magnetobacterium bavaricum]|uniref:Uncharacterized protein n=1 Tax=Candidatus Magnetobacterium bavaricum TaxID=29290 RepID=A0A0F3GX15_9BACT|nr:hypothetical protein MBAV_001386 [Candidatus Magnetobacterium bavaricum]
MDQLLYHLNYRIARHRYLYQNPILLLKHLFYQFYGYKNNHPRPNHHHKHRYCRMSQ